MSCAIRDGKWNAAERLVTFMIFATANEPPSEIIRGILISRGIPFFFFEHTKGKPASIAVPATRLEDARRAVAKATKIRSEIESQGIWAQ
jgi:hypothetical protein